METVLTRHPDEAEIAAISKLMRICTVSLADPLVAKHIAMNETIMLHKTDRFTRGTHFRRYSDGGAFGEHLFYIRMGKRGQCKQYIDRCEITFINGEPTLFQYRLRP